MPKELLRQCWLAPRRAAIALMNLYQFTLSPDHGPLKHLYPYGYCRHEPTCSQYAKIKLEQYGFVWGSVMAIGRLLTCHPWRKPDEAKISKILKL